MKNLKGLTKEYKELKEAQDAAWEEYTAALETQPKDIDIDNKEHMTKVIAAEKKRVAWAEIFRATEKKEKEINRFYKSLKKKIEKREQELKELKEDLNELKSFEGEEGKIDFWQLTL